MDNRKYIGMDVHQATISIAVSDATFGEREDLLELVSVERIRVPGGFGRGAAKSDKRVAESGRVAGEIRLPPLHIFFDLGGGRLVEQGRQGFHQGFERGGGLAECGDFPEINHRSFR
jgi:hypothetical protein